MPIISPLVNCLIFWGNILQELSARVEEAQRVTVFGWWPELEAARVAFWVWMEEHFVHFWFDGPDHTENADRDARWSTYGIPWYQWPLRLPGPLLQLWLAYKLLAWAFF